MSVWVQAALALIAVAAVSRLLGDLPNKHFLALATGCFFYVHPAPMTFGLAALIFWDQVHNSGDNDRFMFLPTLGGALLTSFVSLPLRESMLTVTTAQSGTSLATGLSWAESLRACLAIPLLEQYCLAIVLASLLKKGWTERYALLTAALLFALLQGHPGAMMTRALAGCVYGWLYLRHGFWSAVTAHGLSSAWTLLVTLWLG
jgi:hypothetical protein